MKIVSEMPKRTGGVANAMYPWAEWFDGQVRLLEQGVDFQTKPQGLAAQACTAGRKYGVKVSTRVRPEGVYIQAKPLPQKRV